MNIKNKVQKEAVPFIKFVSTSLATTGVDLVIYSVSITNLEEFFPIFYTFISTLLARMFSDSLKYVADKHLVFNSNEKYGYFKYMFLATSKTLASASIVTMIAALGAEFEEIVKMIVDIILFFPGFIFSKIWVHKK